MANERFRCRYCRKLKARRTPDQCYCSDDACQKARKNAWRRERYSSDPEYRLNQRDSTNAWLEAKGGAAAYYRQYRQERKQRQRDGPRAKAKGKSKPVEDSAPLPREDSVPLLRNATAANRDGLLEKSLIKTGTYELIPLDGANSDAVQAEIRVISLC